MRRGSVIAGRYRLDHPLATGGMARVWTATDEVLGRRVAVKLLLEHYLADASFVRRFRAEALAAARLTHPSVVAVYDTCSDDGVEAIVMELIDGSTLRAHMDARGPLPAEEACRIAGRVAEALAVAHRAQIVHRDIKPANVLLSTSGRVVVTDFGIAKASEVGDLTTDRQMLGTAKYLAPEQVEGAPVDGRSDLYALGVVLYEMLCGRVPFLSDTEAATALARLHQDPPPPRSLRPDLSPELEQVVLRLLARDPDDRWPDAASLARTLGAVAAGNALPPLPAPPAPRPVPAARATAAAPSPAPHGAPVTPGPPPRSPAPPPTDVAPAGRGPGRRRGAPTVFVVALLALAALVVGALAWRLLTPGGTEQVRPAATAFDPFGTDGENDADEGRASDGDPATTWSTETYNDGPVVADYKEGGDGVGLTLDLGEERSVDELVLTSPSTGWDARVYVLADAPAADVASWGEPAATGEDLPADARFALDGAEGRYVLLWITRTTDEGQVVVAEASVEART